MGDSRHPNRCEPPHWGFHRLSPWRSTRLGQKRRGQAVAFCVATALGLIVLQRHALRDVLAISTMWFST